MDIWAFLKEYGTAARVSSDCGWDSIQASKTGLPLPFAGSARPNPKKGAPDTENPSCIDFTVLGGGLRQWSQTMVSEWARPQGRGRSKVAIQEIASIPKSLLRQS